MKIREQYQGTGFCRRGHKNPLRWVGNGGCVHCTLAKRDGEELSPKKTPRQIAKENGEQFFDLGATCSKGHGTVRYTANGRCPACVSAPVRTESWKQSNKEAKRRRYQEDVGHREILKQRRADYYASVAHTEEFKEKARRANKRQYLRNPCAYAARSAIRRGRKLDATPAWLTDVQRFQMELFYLEADRLTKVTSIPHEVDHIIPLQGKTVCGLNVPWNLQVLTREENRRKWDRLPGASELICRTAPAYKQSARDFKPPIKLITI